jgi:Ni,Fe-hydrogenase maturation factor
MKIPERIEIIAVEIVENRRVSEDITPEVRAAVGPVIEMIKGML